MATIDVDGVTLTYDVEGRGAQVLAFVHGWCSKRAHWDAQVNHFKASYRVVCWDRRGMGESRAAPTADSPARHADDLAAILDHEGIEVATVFGHAGGGPSAIAFAARHAVRTQGLVLVDTGLHSPPTDGSEDRFAVAIKKSASRLTGPEGDTYFAQLYRSFFGHRAPQALVEEAVANALATRRETAVAEMAHICIDTVALARQVRCPVLWVSARPEDTSSVVDAFDDVAVGHVVGSGHFVQVEVPEQLNPMIERFLADKVGTR